MIAFLSNTFGFLKIAGNFLNGCAIGSFSGRAQLRKLVSKYVYGSTAVFFIFLILYTFGSTLCTEDQPVVRPLPTHGNANRINARQTSMPRVGFEPTTPVFEQAKMVHAQPLWSTIHILSFKNIQSRCRCSTLTRYGGVVGNSSGLYSNYPGF
jgi:hypothetical protein